MTLSQRLTRAGLTFIVFGTVAAILPGSGVARATTGSRDCTVNGTTTTNQYALGTSATDANTSTTVTTNNSITLTAFENGSSTSNVGFSLSNTTGYTSTVNGSMITVTNTGATASTNVTATFFDTNAALVYTINP